MRRQIAHLHVLGHSLPNGCHGKLLHETEFAASSLSMISQWCSGGDWARWGAQKPSPTMIPRSGLVQRAVCGVWEYAESRNLGLGFGNRINALMMEPSDRS